MSIHVTLITEKLKRCLQEICTARAGDQAAKDTAHVIHVFGSK